MSVGIHCIIILKIIEHYNLQLSWKEKPVLVSHDGPLRLLSKIRFNRLFQGLREFQDWVAITPVVDSVQANGMTFQFCVLFYKWQFFCEAGFCLKVIWTGVST